jgi:hypothetical protein
MLYFSLKKIAAREYCAAETAKEQRAMIQKRAKRSETGGNGWNSQDT